MEEDFYASLKLISGEEVFAKVAACDEGDRTLLLLHSPVMVQQIKLPGANITAGYKVEPWLKTSSEDILIVDMNRIMTMVECHDLEMISIHQRYVKDSAEDSMRNHIDRRMGYISSVKDAKLMLEKLYQMESRDNS